MQLNELTALCPLDGRYRKTGVKLAPYFSEIGLIRSRVTMQVLYFFAFTSTEGITIRRLSLKEMAFLNTLSHVSEEDALIIKKIETEGWGGISRTNHDVVAVIEWIRWKMRQTSLADLAHLVHICLTSEDCNNIAYALMIRGAIKDVIRPAMMALQDKFAALAKNHANLPMLALTHGQAATPTTMGKEFRVFAKRLYRQLVKLDNFHLLVKLNGASGNYCAHVAAYPNVNWIKFSDEFVSAFNHRGGAIPFELNEITTQIEPHDTYAELFDIMRRFNTILIDLNQDAWAYISDEWLVQRVADEVGSSAMPQKVNPIDLENSEGNLGVANALFEFFSRKLPISRRQRDLSDSTVLRNFGIAFGDSLLAYEAALRGLNKISVNEKKIIKDLEESPEVIAEAIQTILRREGHADAYNTLKAITRGKSPTIADFALFIDGFDVSEAVKEELKSIRPHNYIGLAARLAKL